MKHKAKTILLAAADAMSSPRVGIRENRGATSYAAATMRI